jgi:type IV pilus assembly protein PilX
MNSQNKAYTLANKRAIKQRGVVLFVALIALVVMSLAAVALIRSVDTSTIIAGNLSSKQSATLSADSGVETGLNWMAAVADLTTLNANIAASGYYATPTKDPTKSADIAWTDADSRPASGTGMIDAATGKDGSGNTVRYVIQRMCSVAGEPSESTCLLGAPSVGTGSAAVKDAPSAGAVLPTAQSPVYRITARVVGVKNTISYVQAFAY